MIHRILYRMKVTAIISDDILNEVRKYTKGDNLTECIRMALEEWIAQKKIRELNDMVRKEPLEFADGGWEAIRELNRSRS